MPHSAAAPAHWARASAPALDVPAVLARPDRERAPDMPRIGHAGHRAPRPQPLDPP
ncbi:hypothetical protein ACWCXC_29155 [Streptomyces sp. NPDC001515]